ncbi:hypothetical protein Tco_1140017 [Tanacetum coccineum]
MRNNLFMLDIKSDKVSGKYEVFSMYGRDSQCYINPLKEKFSHDDETTLFSEDNPDALLLNKKEKKATRVAIRYTYSGKKKKPVPVTKVKDRLEMLGGSKTEVPDDIKNDETQDVDDEEYVRINEELYDDVNVEMKDAKPANEGKGDEEMTDVEKVDVEPKETNQESTPPPIPTTSTLTTTEAPTSTSVYPKSETHSALQHRVSDLEKEVKELKQVDLSTTLHALIRSEVPPAVNEYLGSTLGDAL